MELKMVDIQRICDECDGGNVTKSWKPQSVPLMLSEGVDITITPTVPVWTCADCGDGYTDHEGEDIREVAVKAVRVAYALGKRDIKQVVSLTGER